MAPSSHAARLRQLFRDRAILTMVELKAALETQVAMTVFRKLRPLSYLSSYSHRGKYYTLAEIARFDQLGLWSHHGAHFSRHGTLLNTCAVLVGDGEAGYTSDELEHLLQVQVKDPLRNLTRQGRIRRTKVAGRWVQSESLGRDRHFSPNAAPSGCAADRRRTRPTNGRRVSCVTSYLYTSPTRSAVPDDAPTLRCLALLPADRPGHAHAQPALVDLVGRVPGAPPENSNNHATRGVRDGVTGGGHRASGVTPPPLPVGRARTGRCGGGEVVGAELVLEAALELQHGRVLEVEQGESTHVAILQGVPDLAGLARIDDLGGVQVQGDQERTKTK